MSRNAGPPMVTITPPDLDGDLPPLDEATAHLANLPADVSAWFPHDPEEINRIVAESFENIGAIPNTETIRHVQQLDDDDEEEEDEADDTYYLIDSDHDEDTARVIRATLEEPALAGGDPPNDTSAGSIIDDKIIISEMDELSALLGQDLSIVGSSIHDDNTPAPTSNNNINNIPDHFPIDMYRPFEEKEEGDSSSLSAPNNTNIASSSSAGLVSSTTAPANIDTIDTTIGAVPDMTNPIARRHRDNMRELYAHDNNTILDDHHYIDHQVHKFMQELSQLNAPPTFCENDIDIANTTFDTTTTTATSLDALNIDIDFNLDIEGLEALKNLQIQDLDYLENNNDAALLEDMT